MTSKLNHADYTGEFNPYHWQACASLTLQARELDMGFYVERRHEEYVLSHTGKRLVLLGHDRKEAEGKLRFLCEAKAYCEA